MTNYDRIKQMSIEEMGYLLLCPYSTDDTDLFMCNKDDCIECTKAWLESEVKE